MPKRLVIVGGVAGGASAAARARRISEDTEVIVLERGPYVSFANCGLPYHMGKVITDREDLLVQTPESLHSRFNLDVRVLHEVIAIDPKKKRVTVRDLDKKQDYSISYDALILSPGAEAFRPPLPGLQAANVFTLKTIPDLDAIIAYLNSHPVRHATVIGGGFIGIEAAENLRHLGLAVTLVEREKQVMPPMDPEMAAILHQHMRFHGVDLRLGSSVTSITTPGNRSSINFAEGAPLETDLIILAIGVRPETKLAKEAGLKIGERGGIVVDEFMRTSDPDILAVGDVVESKDPVTGATLLVPLAGPANRQGRFAADNALSDTKKSYRGTMGTWICKVFDLAAGQTGSSEKFLQRLGRSYEKVYIHPASHAGYYPGAKPMTLKLLFDPKTGGILGAQAVGGDGIDKRIDVIATAMAGKMTVGDLTHLELSYAPPYGSAKDPVNLAGMVAENILGGLHDIIHVEGLKTLPPESYLLLDVRTPAEHEAGHIPGSKLIPVDELRGRLGELPKDKEIIIYCQAGLRGYVAHRTLRQLQFKSRNLIGGYKTWQMFNEDAWGERLPAPTQKEVFCSTPTLAPQASAETFELDACGLQCPGPLLKMQQRMQELNVGQQLRIVATDPGFPLDAAAWCNRSGNKVIRSVPENGRFVVTLEKTESGVSPSLACQSGLPQPGRSTKKLTMVVFSNDLDRAYATFIIANGAVAMGMEVTLFFTFWGLNILRKQDAPPVSKSLVESMFGMMMPRGSEALGLSKMHFAGLGTAMMKQVMADKNVSPLPELIANARKGGVKMVACTMSMDVMGIKKEELIEGVIEGGVAAYIDSAADSGINLFV